MKYLFLVLLMISCSKPEKPIVSNGEARFKVGECVTVSFSYTDGEDNEFVEAQTETITIVNKILKIGTRNYLVDIGAGLLREKEIKDVDSDYELVDCSKLE